MIRNTIPAREISRITHALPHQREREERQGLSAPGPQPLRYFVYCRKSSEAEDRQMMSIESQRTELLRSFASAQIVDIIEEAKSAKSPGRNLFNGMMTRLEAGEADGLIAWAPDRLARNSIDGGRIVYLLDRGVLRDLKFATYTYENNPQGKFMLAIMFGQSKYYSDALSENVKRGNRTKIEHGWRPNMAPLGYLNDRSTKTIVPDPAYFPLVRRLFELMLRGDHSPSQIVLLARDEWGFRTPIRRKIGGVPLAMSSLYKILSNHFYAGLILWNGQLYPGSHTPVVTIDEFNQVRAALARPDPKRPSRHTFTFTGLIRCGSCGCQITAEHKRNRFGSRYVYYHCTKKRLPPRCPERSVELRALELQIAAFLHSVSVPAAIEASLLGPFSEWRLQVSNLADARQRSLERTTTAIDHQLRELINLRLRAMISDAEFIQQRATLQREHQALTEQLRKARNEPYLIEPARLLLSLSVRAAEWFDNGDDAIKRLIFEIVGSNPVLTAGKLRVQAAKPFLAIKRCVGSPSLLARGEEVRTLRFHQTDQKPASLATCKAFQKLAFALAAPECQNLVSKIHTLMDLVGDNQPKKEAA
jgi:DNA invertase Pin-like site-specific DNA recombinase